MVRVMRATDPLVVRPVAALVATVKALMGKAVDLSADMHVFKKASSWCITALKLALKEKGAIGADVDVRRDSRRQLMLEIWARWWPCWESPQRVTTGLCRQLVL